MTAVALLRWSGAICICTAVPLTFPSFLFFRMRLTRLFDPAIVDRMSCFAALGHVYLPEARMRERGLYTQQLRREKKQGLVWLFAKLLRVSRGKHVSEIQSLSLRLFSETDCLSAKKIGALLVRTGRLGDRIWDHLTVCG